MNTFGIIVISFLAFYLYFLPSIIALRREHHQTSAIFVLNLLLGWTFLGWVAAIVWSASSTQAPFIIPRILSVKGVLREFVGNLEAAGGIVFSIQAVVMIFNGLHMAIR